MGQKKIAKAGRCKDSGRKSGLVQARIEGFITLSEKEVAKVGRFTQEEGGHVGEQAGKPERSS